MKYLVDGKEFDTKQEAEAYIDSLKTYEYLVIYASPDLTEGMGLQRTHVFPLESFAKLKIRENFRNSDTVKKLAEIVLEKRFGKYGGVMGTLQMLPNYKVISMSEPPSYYTKKHNDKTISLKDLPVSFDEALNYVAEKLEPVLQGW